MLQRRGWSSAVLMPNASLGASGKGSQGSDGLSFQRVSLCFQTGSPGPSGTAGRCSVHRVRFFFLLGAFLGAPVLSACGRRQLPAFVPVTRRRKRLKDPHH